MFKRNILIAFVFCVLCFIQFTDVLAVFDPETTEFSQMKTIGTWVRTDVYKDQKAMEYMQNIIASAVPQNPLSMKLVMPVMNDNGVTQYFGKTCYTIAAIELPFLRFVHDVSKQKQPITLEIAAGVGLVSRKVPFAFENGGLHYINEFSSMLMGVDLVVDSFLANTNRKDLKAYIATIPGNCFGILSTHPELKESVDAIYVQNLQHFFNPLQDFMFIELLADLLAPDGCAFLCANSYLFGMDEEHPLYKLWKQQRQTGDRYFGFAQYDVLIKRVGGTEAELLGTSSDYSGVVRPKDDTPVGVINLSEPTFLYSMDLSKQGLGFREIFQRKQRVVANAFSPSIYRNTIADHPRLEIVDAFFIDADGVKCKAWGQNIRFAAVIIKKKSKSELQALGSIPREGIKIDGREVVSDFQAGTSTTASSLQETASASASQSTSSNGTSSTTISDKPKDSELIQGAFQKSNEAIFGIYGYSAFDAVR